HPHGQRTGEPPDRPDQRGRHGDESTARARQPLLHLRERRLRHRGGEQRLRQQLLLDGLPGKWRSAALHVLRRGACGAHAALGGVSGTWAVGVSVTVWRGATARGRYSLTVTGPPPPTPPGCQTGRVLRERLSGPALNGQTPSGQASADETRFSGCGGFSLLSV